MTLGAAIRRWALDLRWRLDTLRDRLADRVARAQGAMQDGADAAKWKLEAVASARRSERSSAAARGFGASLRKVATCLKSDAASLSVKPRTLVLGSFAFLAVGLMLGMFLAPRQKPQPSGLPSLPPSTWTNFEGRSTGTGGSPPRAVQGTSAQPRRDSRPPVSKPGTEDGKSQAQGLIPKQTAPRVIESGPR